MSIKEVLHDAVQILGKEMILDAEVLLAHAVNKDRGWMMAHGDVEVDETTAEVFRNMIARRKAGEPVAYIIGTKEFFGLDFKVDTRVLVPRPETEMLVELGLEEFDKNPQSTGIDVGTGSGAIAVSVAKHAPETRLIATDISTDALAVARENAYTHEVVDRISFLKGDLLEPIDFSAGSYVILANLPYVSEEEYKAEASIQKEPKIALVAREDGNALYRELFEQLKKLPEGVVWVLFAEFDPRHTEWMRATAKEYFSNKEIRIQKDLAGHERILSIRPV